MRTLSLIHLCPLLSPKRSLRPWQHGWAYDWSLPLRVPLWELELLEDVLEAG